MYFNKFDRLVIVTSLLGLALASCKQGKSNTSQNIGSQTSDYQSAGSPSFTRQTQGLYVSQDLSKYKSNYSQFVIKVVNDTTITRCGFYKVPDNNPTGVADYNISYDTTDADKLDTFVAKIPNVEYTLLGYYNTINNTFVNFEPHESKPITYTYVEPSSSEFSTLTTKCNFAQ